MGVIHKLKKEVIDFILDQKVHDSSLSCRKLVLSVKQKFHVSLSKSSVNDVLKGARLSSPVGRRSGKKPVKKFQLPPGKVEALFPAAFRQEQPGRTDEAPISRERESVPSPKDFSPREIFANGKEMIAGAGCVFLKAAEWELANHPFFSDLYREHLPKAGDGKAEALANTLLYMPFWEGKGNGENNLAQHGLSLFSQEAPPLPLSESSDIIKAINNASQMYSKMALQMASNFVFVKETVVVLENGKQIKLEPELRNILDENVQSEKGYPINFAVRLLSNLISGNVQSVFLIHNNRLQYLTDKEVMMILSFQDHPLYKIKNFLINDLNGDEIVNFQNLLSGKRNLIIGFEIDRNHFLAKAVNKKTSALPKHEIVRDEKLLYCQAVCLDLKDLTGDNLYPELRNKEETEMLVQCILVSASREESPYLALLTHPKETQVIENDILEALLVRFPASLARAANQANPNQAALCQEIARKIDTFSENLPKISIAEGIGIIHINKFLVNQIHEYCLISYFPGLEGKVCLNEAISNIYNLKGQISRQGGEMLVQLQLPENNDFNPHLEFAVSLFNSRNVKNRREEKILLKISAQS